MPATAASRTESARLLRGPRRPSRRPRRRSCAPRSARRSCGITPIAPRRRDVATRRTSILNRAWAELRDPVRRLHYDHALESGRAATLDWPLEEGERGARRRATPPLPRRAGRAEPVAPAAVALGGRVPHPGRGVPRRPGGPGPLDRRASHRRRRTGGRTRSATGCASRHATTRSAGASTTGSACSSGSWSSGPRGRRSSNLGLRDAYLAAGEELRGAMVIAGIGEGACRGHAAAALGGSRAARPARRVPRRARPTRPGGAPRRERRAAPQLPRVDRDRAELHRLPVGDRRAPACRARGARRGARRARDGRAGHRAGPLVQPRAGPDRGAASSTVPRELLAAIARGDHPTALDPRRVTSPWRRISAARERLGTRRAGASAHR